MHDEENRIFATKDGYIKLSCAENEILKALIANKGKVVKFEKNPHAYIKRLRKKLKGEVEIKTRNVAGYYIE